jgi:hypothetical protein
MDSALVVMVVDRAAAAHGKATGATGGHPLGATSHTQQS